MSIPTLESLIAQNQTEDALARLRELLDGLQRRYPDQLTLLQSRMADMRDRERSGLLTREQCDTEKNQVNASLLDLLGQIRNDLREHFAFLQLLPGNRSRLQDYVQLRSRGKYQIKEELREGSSLVNFKAFDTSTGRDVVIKVLKLDSKLQESFKREVERVKVLKHRDIIKIQDVYTDELPYFLVADYVWGIDISDLIHSIGSIPFYLTINILVDLCDVLDYLRYRNIFHTRIRPDKIMLDEENKPMISPFEVIKAGSDERPLTKFAQDCRYLPPEVFEGGLETGPASYLASEKSDLFCLGLLAYEMLTGEALIQGETIQDIILNRRRFFRDEAFCEERMGKLDSVCPPECAKIIRLLLAENPENRYPSMWELAEKLQTFSPSQASTLAIKRLQESYARCLATRPSFTDDFYRAFFQAIPGVAHRFSSENRERQQKMLQAALHAFLECGADKSFLEKLIGMRGHQGVSFEQYQIFIETLTGLIAETDPRWKHGKVAETWKAIGEEVLSELGKVLNAGKKGL